VLKSLLLEATMLTLMIESLEIRKWNLWHSNFIRTRWKWM